MVLLILAYLALRWFLNTAPEKLAYYIRVVFFVAIALLVLYFIATGRLNWVFAMLGIFIAFIVRLLPLLLRFAPDLQRLWLFFRRNKQNQSGGADYADKNRKMTVAEAYEILGLKPGAAKQDIIQAHRKLIQRNHPDHGGTDYLAAKINLAKNILIKHIH